jgi:hypothetical protein
VLDGTQLWKKTSSDRCIKSGPRCSIVLTHMTASENCTITRATPCELSRSPIDYSMNLRETKNEIEQSPSLHPQRNHPRRASTRLSSWFGDSLHSTFDPQFLPYSQS